MTYFNPMGLSGGAVRVGGVVGGSKITSSLSKTC